MRETPGQLQCTMRPHLFGRIACVETGSSRDEDPTAAKPFFFALSDCRLSPIKLAFGSGVIIVDKQFNQYRSSFSSIYGLLDVALRLVCIFPYVS